MEAPSFVSSRAGHRSIRHSSRCFAASNRRPQQYKPVLAERNPVVGMTHNLERDGAGQSEQIENGILKEFPGARHKVTAKRPQSVIRISN
jgi:hypothetical protein